MMKRKSLPFAILDSPFFIRKRAEAGYNMVVLIVAITVLNILVAAMLPMWSTQIRREKEEELVFRGFQYAEAIRVFHNRYQRYPARLDELMLVKPRCIRQLWKDPMTEDGKWGLIFQNQQGSLQPQPQGQPPPDQKGETSTEEDENGREQQFGPKPGETAEVGPIIGVRSRSREKSMLVFFGRERYDEWQFTETMLVAGDPSRGSGPTGQAQSLKLSTRWLGRPMRFVDQPPGLPEGTLPDGKPPRRTGNRNPADSSPRR